MCAYCTYRYNLNPDSKQANPLVFLSSVAIGNRLGEESGEVKLASVISPTDKLLHGH